jgi:hypothetical protein
LCFCWNYLQSFLWIPSSANVWAEWNASMLDTTVSKDTKGMEMWPLPLRDLRRV